MSRDEILDVLRQTLIKVIDDPPKDVGLASRLREDVGLDSFAALELTFELEASCHVEFPQEVVTKLRTVENVVTYIEGKQYRGIAQAGVG